MSMKYIFEKLDEIIKLLNMIIKGLKIKCDDNDH